MFAMIAALRSLLAWVPVVVYFVMKFSSRLLGLAKMLCLFFVMVAGCLNESV